MKFNVSKVATLANLSLTPEEEKKFAAQLKDTLSYIEKLEEVDTKDVQITSQVTGLENITREDIPAVSLSQEQVMQNAKSVHNSMFKVKAVLDNE
jgi:aspartyl-tRNA(Asn)/glutamyl-tRNA(Gln) amidotransferase subunit C